MIQLNRIQKTFKVATRTAGLRQSMKALFRREYTFIEALNDISFTIDEGEIVGYIGPNGAGKSTSIKIMSGILVPDSGTCNIMGFTPWEDRVHYVRHIGVVFGQRSQLWWDVPVADSFALLQDIYKIPDQEYKKTLELLTETLELQSIVEMPVRQLSLGQRMRCELAASLLHRPRILFLDEPTIGLDAVSKVTVRNFIRTINNETGVTVLLTTHDMQDIEALAHRVMVIGKGKLLFDGTIDTLKNRFGTHKVLTIDYKSSNHVPYLKHAQLMKHTKERATFHFDAQRTNVSELLTELSSQVQLVDVTIHAQPIEETIIKLYKEYEI